MGFYSTPCSDCIYLDEDIVDANGEFYCRKARQYSSLAGNDIACGYFASRDYSDTANWNGEHCCADCLYLTRRSRSENEFYCEEHDAYYSGGESACDDFVYKYDYFKRFGITDEYTEKENNENDEDEGYEYDDDEYDEDYYDDDEEELELHPEYERLYLKANYKFQGEKAICTRF